MPNLLKFAHRINTSDQLSQVSQDCGVELDLRDHNEDLILHHDPFSNGEKFSDYLMNYQHSGMILNVKSEGIENRCLELLQAYKISSYFFLDVSIPFIHRLIQRGEKNIAIRYSIYEPVELALSFKGQVNWVWVDCFFGFSFPVEDYLKLKPHFKICMVSPELQGRSIEEISEFKKGLEGREIDAVCTKRPDLW